MEAGQVKVFQWDNGTKNWKQIGQDVVGETTDKWFGYIVDLSDPGNILAVAAPGTGINGAYSGTVRIYELTDSTWKQIGEGINGEAENDVVAPFKDDPGNPFVPYVNYFDLSANGKKVAIGAPGHDTTGNNTNEGRTRVFELNEGSTVWEKLGQSIDGTRAFEQSGVSVGLTEDGQILVIGAYWNYDINPNNTIGYTKVFESSVAATVSHL